MHYVPGSLSGQPDMKATFDGLPGLYLLLAADPPLFTVLAVNDAFLEATHSRREALLGKALFDVFPDDPSRAEKNGGEARLAASLIEAIQTKQRQVMPVQPAGGTSVARLVIDAAQSLNETPPRYWIPSNTPILNAEGEVSCIVHALHEVKDRAPTLGTNERAALAERLVDLASESFVVRDVLGPDNEQSTIRFWSAGAERMYGYTAAEALGADIHTLLQTRYPEDFSSIAMSLRTKGRWEGELLHTRHDGARIPVHSIWVITDRIGNQALQVNMALEINRDITALKALYAEREQRASIVDLATDAIVLIDLGTRMILEWNPAAQKLYGFSRDEAVGAMADKLLWANPDLEEQAQRTIAELLDTGYAERDFLVKRRNGEEFVAHTRLGIAKQPDDSILVFSISHDRTPEIQAQQETAARIKAEEAISARDEFLAIAAHELKTPITSLRGFTELLEHEITSVIPDRMRSHRYLRSILAQSARLSTLIEQLLDVGRLGAGPAVLQRSEVDLCQLVRDAIVHLQRRVPGVNVVQLGDIQGPIWVRVDVFRIEQAVANVLNNAVKFAPNFPIEVGIGHDGETATVWVRDFGLGVAEELHERIFERAFQAQPKSADAGMGLGLYISRQIISMHSGSIQTQAPVDGRGGALFVIVLPLDGA